MVLGALAALTLLGSVTGSDLSGSQLRTVTLASPNVYERLGEKHFKMGMAFQGLALCCMLVLVVAQVYKKMKRKTVVDRLNFFDAVTQTPEVAAFFFTVMAYCVLDGLYEPTFVGSKLQIFTVNSTCTGMNCTDPFSVLAGGVQEALAESCHQFKVHNRECSDKTRWQEISGYALCQDDPANVAEVYFKGASNMALSFAFIVGCCLAFLLNVSDVIRYWKQDKVLSSLLPVVKVGEHIGGLQEQIADGSDIIGVMSALKLSNVEEITTRKHREEEQEAKTVMRYQIFMRMAMEGLSYGLMMMILEVEIDGDCLVMRAMLPIHIASMWAYTIISVTSLVVISFCVILVLNFVKDVSGVRKFLTRFSTAFIGLIGIFVFFAFAAYVYSVILAVYLAYTVPSDSAVVVGCGLAMLSMASQAAAMYDPQPSDHWYDDEEEDEDDDEEQGEDEDGDNL